MLYRTARALTIPASVTLLCSLEAKPPRWLTPPTLRRPAQVEAPKPEIKPFEEPKILAVNERIAKRINALRPCVKERLVRVTEKLPKKVTLLVTSATRTRQEQAALRPTFGVKARPGTSTHEDGRAVDLNVIVDGKRVSPRMNQKIIGKVMASEGFRHLGRIDPVHYSVPKEKIDTSLTAGPNLQVMTMAEAKELRAEAEELRAEAEELRAAGDPATEAAGKPLNPTSGAQSAISFLPPGL